jgi:hypothetical protein
MELLNILRRAPGSLLLRAGSASCLTALVIILAPGRLAAAQPEASEYAVKAAYLSKFGQYVEWPSSAFPASGGAATLCIVGEDPFGTVLDKAVADQTISGRSIIVRRLKTVGRDSGCHILYIARSDKLQPRQVIELVRGNSVLTVSDAVSGDGAIINFVIKDNRVRFDIDDEAAAQNELTMSSKLLSLALNVKRRQSREAR